MFTPRPAQPSDESLSRVVAYIAKAEDEATATLEEQHRLIAEDVAKHDATLAVTIVETLHRPCVPPLARSGLCDALKALEIHQAGVLLVADRTRLGMTLMDQVLVQQIVECDLDAQVVTVCGDLDASRSDRGQRLDALWALRRYREFLDQRRKEETFACLRRVQGWPLDGSVSTSDPDPESPENREE